MNICNYIRLEKMKEAESFFKEKFQYTKMDLYLQITLK